MSSNEAIQQLKDMLPQYLDMIGASTKRPFHCLNPEHEDNHPSMSFNTKDGQHVHYFSCHANWDIFDLIAIKELGASITNGSDGSKVIYSFTEAFNKAVEVLRKYS